MASTGTASASDRLLQAAGELFYAEGVHSVGIDRIIERACGSQQQRAFARRGQRTACERVGKIVLPYKHNGGRRPGGRVRRR